MKKCVKKRTFLRKDPARQRVTPLLRGGVDAPIKQKQRYLNIGAAGEVKSPSRSQAEV
jgi:hypothetical protein